MTTAGKEKMETRKSWYVARRLLFVDSLSIFKGEATQTESEQEFVELCSKLHQLDMIVISEEIFTEILFDQVCWNAAQYYPLLAYLS